MWAQQVLGKDPQPQKGLITRGHVQAVRGSAHFPASATPPPQPQGRGAPGPALTSGLGHARSGQRHGRRVLGLARQPLPSTHRLEHLEDGKGRHV